MSEDKWLVAGTGDRTVAIEAIKVTLSDFKKVDSADILLARIDGDIEKKSYGSSSEFSNKMTFSTFLESSKTIVAEYASFVTINLFPGEFIPRSETSVEDVMIFTT